MTPPTFAGPELAPLALPMNRRLHTLFTTFLFPLLLVACGTQHEPASARVPDPKAKLPLPDGRQFGAVNIQYADTNSADWRVKALKLDSFYAVQHRMGFNGAVLVGYKNKVLYERYYGYANKEAGVPWSPQTSSQLASTSKTFTGAAILYLHSRHYLNIDDYVTAYIDSFPYPQVTIRTLLNHRSGLPDYLKWVGNFRKDTKTPMYNDDVLDLMIRHKPGLDFKTNTRFKYSNSNYLLLASIIERVTEMPFKDFMKKHIFDPVGLKNTFVFDPADGFPANSSVSYKANWAREPIMFADGVYGDKGIYSTTQDMYRWDQSFYQNKLLDNATLELAYGPCSFEKPGVKNYGLGWRMLCYEDGYKVIFHNGWWHGNNTCFYRFVKDNFTIIVLGNKYTSSIYRQPPVVYRIINGTDAAHSEGFGGDEGTDPEPVAKPQAVKAAVHKAVPAKSAAAKKAPAKKPIAARTPAKKTPAKPAVKKAPAKKPVAKKTATKKR